MPRRSPNDPLPRIFDRSTDETIPRATWEAWIPANGEPRKLRRALTAEERGLVEARAAELAPVVAPYGEHERDEVMLALVDLFQSYRAMRQSEDEAIALVESTARALDELPGWAILKVCKSMRTNGVWRDGKFNRQWAPNDPEIADAVRKEVEHYKRAHANAAALLAATVEVKP